MFGAERTNLITMGGNHFDKPLFVCVGEKIGIISHFWSDSNRLYKQGNQRVLELKFKSFLTALS